MKDFIYDDDHDHGCSITSLSVQIFTVPTIAHYLIAKEDIFAKIVTTFNSECGHRRNAGTKICMAYTPLHKSFCWKSNGIG